MENPPQPDHKADRASTESNGESTTQLIRQLDWAFWANSAWAVIGLVLATFFATPLFDFFNSAGKIISIVAGGFLGISVVAAFVIYSRRLHRKGRTSAQLEEQAEREQTKLRDKIDHLESELDEAKRKLAEHSARNLTEQQETIIIAACSRFPGQKAMVQCLTGDIEGHQFGQMFRAAMLRANWDARKIRVGINFADAGTVMVGISKADYDKGIVPPAAVALDEALHQCGLNDPGKESIGIIDDLDVGEILLIVGVKTVVRLSPPQYVFPHPTDETFRGERR